MTMRSDEVAQLEERHDSQTDGESDLDAKPKSYYPTMEEMIASDPSKLEKHLKGMNKSHICCLVRDLVAQLKYTRSRLDLSNTRMESVECSVSKLTSEVEEVTKHLKTPDNQITENTSVAQVTKPAIIANSHLMQIRVNGIPEKDVKKDDKNKQELIINHDHSEIAKVFEKLGENPKLKDLQRLGKRDTSRARPRTLLLTLHSEWDVRKLLSKTYKLKDAPEYRQIFVSPALSPKDQMTERKILYTRKNLIAAGEDRKDIRIKEMKLYVKGEEVPLQDIQH